MVFPCQRGKELFREKKSKLWEGLETCTEMGCQRNVGPQTEQLE